MIDDIVMSLDPVKCGFQIADEHRTENKGDSQSKGVYKQHQHPLKHMPLLGSQHQGRTKERSHTRSPANGEHHAKDQGGKEAHICGVDIPADALENVQLENAQKVQAKKHHNETRYYIDGCLMLLQKAPHRSGQSPKDHEYNGKAHNEAKGAPQRFAGTLLAASCEIGNINGKHGKQAR